MLICTMQLHGQTVEWMGITSVGRVSGFRDMKTGKQNIFPSGFINSFPRLISKTPNPCRVGEQELQYHSLTWETATVNY